MAGTSLAPSNGVNIFDALIIYLACGAPFGVYYFLQQPERRHITRVWVKTVSNFLFWPASALTIIRRSDLFRSRSGIHFEAVHELDARFEKRVCEIQKDLEKLFFDNEAGASIYQFRETFERYVGLSLAVKSGSEPHISADSELFRVAGHKNNELAVICLNRRNRSRLLIHQIQAREDFSKVLLSLADLSSKWAGPAALANELAGLLDDTGGQHKFEKVFAGAPQIDGRVRVRKIGRDLWKPEIHKPLPANHLSMSLRPATATAASPVED